MPTETIFGSGAYSTRGVVTINGISICDELRKKFPKGTVVAVDDDVEVIGGRKAVVVRVAAPDSVLLKSLDPDFHLGHSGGLIEDFLECDIDKCYFVFEEQIRKIHPFDNSGVIKIENI